MTPSTDPPSDVQSPLPQAAQTDLLARLACHLQDMAKLGEELQSLSQERKLSAANSPQCQLHEVPRSSREHYKSCTSDINTDENWNTVFKEGQNMVTEESEEEKDSLANLLTFTGLFSAVVTAFAVESSSWLQADPGDTSSRLLGRISLQISSFVSEGTFINSTAPALSYDNVTDSFQPGLVVVSVNALWFISLVLSLLAALFILAAQQWIRHYLLPPLLPVSQKIELSHLRRSSIGSGQVRAVVALLPVVLQLSLVLFLLGLLLALYTVNTAVAATCTAVAGAGVLVFGSLHLLPLFDAYSSYKSPLLPTIIFVFEAVIRAPVFITALVIALLATLGETRLMYPITRYLTSTNLYRKLVANPAELIMQCAQGFTERAASQLEDFWLSKEMRNLIQMYNRPEDGALPKVWLATRVLSLSPDPATVSAAKACLEELSPPTIVLPLSTWILYVLRHRDFPGVLHYSRPRIAGNPSFYTTVDRFASVQHADSILYALARLAIWDPQPDSPLARETELILILHRIVIRRDAPARLYLPFYNILVRVIRSYGTPHNVDFSRVSTTLPLILLFHSRDTYDNFDGLDAIQIAIDSLEMTEGRLLEPDVAYAEGVPDFVLACTALGFLQLQRRPGHLTAAKDLLAVDNITVLLTSFLERWHTVICDMSANQTSNQTPPAEYRPLFNTALDAIQSISNSLSSIYQRCTTGPSAVPAGTDPSFLPANTRARMVTLAQTLHDLRHNAMSHPRLRPGLTSDGLLQSPPAVPFATPISGSCRHEQVERGEDA